MEFLESLLILCGVSIVGLASGIAAGCEIHLLRVREAINQIEGKLNVAVRLRWADRLWLRLLILALGTFELLMGWQSLICTSTALFLLTLVVAYWVTRARRADNNIAGFG